MFFEKELILFNILDVIELDQKDVNMFNCGRKFNALSFRLKADAVLKTQTDEYHMGDHFVSYVPARLDYSRSASIDKLIAIHFETTDYTTKSIEHFIPKDHEILTRLFLRILDCWNKKECGYKYRCSAILYEIFAECYSQNFTNVVTKSKISSSVDYILKNYTDPYLTIENIAKRSFMSEVYFRKLFKEEYGVSPINYMISRRIDESKYLLAETDLSMSQIAQLLGFSSLSYFSQVFRRTQSTTPMEYRQSTKNM